MPATLKSGSPARWAAFVSLAIGAALILFGAWLLISGANTPVPLAIALTVIGALEAITGWFALHVQRVAWAFACSLNGVMAVVLLFGAPRVRDLAEVNIGLALLPMFVFGVVTLLYALAGDDY